jgi:membrane protein
MLAAVPFVLLLLSGLGYVLNQSEAQSTANLWRFIDQLLPPHSQNADSPMYKIINDVIRARRSVGIYSLIGFVWFSTRLFGTLRSVLAEVFDIEQERSIIVGKLFDIEITVVSTILFVAYTALNAYLRLLPNRKIRWQYALLAAIVTSALFELAKALFTSYVGHFNPGSLYTGTLTAIVVIVFWVYYASVIFILGGEVGRVYELRRVRRLQRESLEE